MSMSFAAYNPFPQHLSGGMVLMGIIVAVLVFFLLAWLVQITWNYTLPDLFGVKQVSFWQALALLVLFGILLGGMRMSMPRW